MRYLVHINMVGYGHMKVPTPEGVPRFNNISDLESGFWLNSQYEMTTGPDNKFYIPASQIRMIEKIDS